MILPVSWSVALRGMFTGIENILVGHEDAVEDLTEQAFKVSQGTSTRFQTVLIRWRSPTPPLILRLEAIITWAGLPSELYTRASDATLP
jgi:hypothetical protein